MTGVMPVVFLAPGGDFEKRTKFETLPVIPITATPEVRAKLAEDAKRAAARAAGSLSTMALPSSGLIGPLPLPLGWWQAAQLAA